MASNYNTYFLVFSWFYFRIKNKNEYEKQDQNGRSSNI